MTTAQLTVTIIIASWKNTLGRADKLFSTLTEEQFLREVAPGKNRILYLLGHLTAVPDSLHTALRLGGRIHPPLRGLILFQPGQGIQHASSTSVFKEVLT